MPTLKTLREQFIEEEQIGRLGTTTSAGDSSSIIDLTRFGGPTAGNEWTKLDPMRVTSGSRAGDKTFFKELAPSTGDITCDPVLGGTPGSSADFVIVRRKFADSIDRLDEALNRGLNRWARRRMKVGLSYVPDGDLLGAAVATFWTGTNATPSYVDLAHPNGYATRVLQVLTSAANGYAQPASGGIECHPAETWDFVTWLRAADASKTAELQIRDITNSAAITPTLAEGALTTTSRSLVEVRGSFIVPAGCSLWVPRIVGQENPSTVQMGPFLAAPRGARVYTSQAHFQFPIDAGEFYTRSKLTGTDIGPEQGAYDKRAYACEIDQLGWGLAFQFPDEAPEFPLYFEALVGYADLSADTDSTHCPEDVALAAMGREFYESLAKRTRRDDGSSPFDRERDAAIEKWLTFERRFAVEPDVVVRREYSGQVSL